MYGFATYTIAASSAAPSPATTRPSRYIPHPAAVSAIHVYATGTAAHGSTIPSSAPSTHDSGG